MDLQTMRAALRERAGIASGDPIATNTACDRLINLALRAIDDANPNGWWWQRIEFDVTVAASTESQSIGTTVIKVVSVFASQDGFDFYELIRVSREQMMRLNDATAGSAQQGPPVWWSTSKFLPNALWISPAPPVGYVLRVATIRAEADLTAPTSVPLRLPAQWHDFLVVLALPGLLRLLHRMREALDAQVEAESVVRDLRTNAAQAYVGAAFPRSGFAVAP